MNKESLYKITKMNNLNKLVIVKYGNFYKSYEEDAVILWSIFKYRIIDGKVSFPVSCFGSVVSKLVRFGISVVVVNTDSDIKVYLTNNDKYNEYISSSKKDLETEELVKELKLKVEEKIKLSYLNYDKLLNFINSL